MRETRCMKKAANMGFIPETGIILLIYATLYPGFQCNMQQAVHLTFHQKEAQEKSSLNVKTNLYRINENPCPKIIKKTKTFWNSFKK